VSAFRRTRGESVSSNGNVTLPHALAPRVEARRGTIRLRGPKQGLNRVALAHKRNVLKQKVHLQRAVHRFMVQWYTSLRFVCIASEKPQKSISGGAPPQKYHRPPPPPQGDIS